jgi:hypothetical protein
LIAEVAFIHHEKRSSSRRKSNKLNQNGRCATHHGFMEPIAEMSSGD